MAIRPRRPVRPTNRTVTWGIDLDLTTPPLRLSFSVGMTDVVSLTPTHLALTTRDSFMPKLTVEGAGQ